MVGILEDKDRIFTNLYGLQDWGLEGAKKRGAWNATKDMLDLGRVFNAPKWKIFAKIRIPNALPYILSALKITATAAVVGAIVGEFVASQKGLGYVIVTTQSSMNTGLAFAALIWISVVGLVLYGLVVLLAHLWAPWAEGID